jgi:hypothetical protein
MIQTTIKCNVLYFIVNPRLEAMDGALRIVTGRGYDDHPRGVGARTNNTMKGPAGTPGSIVPISGTKKSKKAYCDGITQALRPFTTVIDCGHGDGRFIILCALLTDKCCAGIEMNKSAHAVAQVCALLYIYALDHRKEEHIIHIYIFQNTLGYNSYTALPPPAAPPRPQVLEGMFLQAGARMDLHLREGNMTSVNDWVAGGRWAVGGEIENK